MTRWNELTCDDFDSATGFSKISIEDDVVELMFDEEIVVSQESVDQFKQVFDSWSKQKPDVAQTVERFVQRFLPGRKVAPDELELFLVSLTYIDNSATAVTYFLRITGEYEDPNYELCQFDSQSTIELRYKIHEGKLDTSNCQISSTNDFDD